MRKIHRLITLFMTCGLLALTACDAAPREQTTTTNATEQTLTAATTLTETTTAPETSATTASDTTVPPAKIKPIRSIFLYTYNAYAAATAHYGYNFYYFAPDRIASGRTKNTPINTDDPLKTENMELLVSVVPEGGVYEAICEQMWELRFDRIPSRLDANRGIVMDHSEFYLTVTFENGSSRTFSGYAAIEMSDIYASVVDLLKARIRELEKAAG